MADPETAAAREDLPALEARLRQHFRVQDTTFRLADYDVRIMHPANSDELINEEEFVRDERMPYWADIWPASRALGAHLLDLPRTKSTLLELGCGCGLVAACAAMAGFAVTATDYETDALSFARVNVARNSGADPATALLDWRELRDDMPRFDTVVASDVLYEPSLVEPLARVFDRALTATGVGIVADPGRIARAAFLDAAHELGLITDTSDETAITIDSTTHRVALIRIRRDA